MLKGLLGKHTPVSSAAGDRIWRSPDGQRQVISNSTGLSA